MLQTESQLSTGAWTRRAFRSFPNSHAFWAFLEGFHLMLPWQPSLSSTNDLEIKNLRPIYSASLEKSWTLSISLEGDIKSILPAIFTSTLLFSFPPKDAHTGNPSFNLPHKMSHEKSQHLVAFFCLIIPVGVWEVDVASCFFHHLFNIVAPFADYMRMFCVWDIHLQGDPIALCGNNVLFLDVWKRKEQLIKRHIYPKGTGLTKSDPVKVLTDFLRSSWSSFQFLSIYPCS